MIELVRFKHTEENLTNQVHGILNITKEGETVFRCSTLERRWMPKHPSFSCVPPSQDSEELYTLRRREGYGDSPYQQLELTGDKTWLIHTSKDSPIYFGEQLVYCEASGLYEFNDFRETLNKVAAYLTKPTDVTIRWTDQTNIISATYKSKTYFADDDLLPTYPVIQ